MSVAAQSISEVVQLHHHYSAKPDKVFAAWSTPQAIGKWFGPHSHECKVEKYDFREGGEYQIRLLPISDKTDCGGEPGQESVCAGKFVQIISPSKLIMTFTWIEGPADIGDTLLTIELKATREGGTDLYLTHERLPNEAMRQAHHGGWQGTLECLQDYLWDHS